MKTIGYIRVSTTRQAAEGVSLDSQKSKIRAYCDLKDLELVDIISDAGKSGKRADREGFQEILSLCKSKEVEAVVIYSLSRFTRSTRDLLDFVDRFVINGTVTLHSLSESLDTSSPTGRFMLKVMAAMNELEREQIVERTKASLDYKREAGEKTGGDVPFGFDLSEDGKTLTENIQEQGIIRIIEELKGKKYSLNAIAKFLNGHGYSTKKGSTWNHVQVGRILRRAS
ncbi:MAG: recombinase family protein [Smithella sp.]